VEGRCQEVDQVVTPPGGAVWGWPTPPHGVAVMRHGVDGFSPSSWEPQEEGMMSIAASFSLNKKPRFNRI
jgi:hypothetical protein